MFGKAIPPISMEVVLGACWCESFSLSLSAVSLQKDTRAIFSIKGVFNGSSLQSFVMTEHECLQCTLIFNVI